MCAFESKCVSICLSSTSISAHSASIIMDALLLFPLFSHHEIDDIGFVPLVVIVYDEV